jgi:exopolysaccharide biosynthesis WecB/TagA/CpsF family protein
MADEERCRMALMRGDGVALPPKRHVFGVGVSATDSYEEVVANVVAAARARSPLMVSALSVHALMLAAEQPAMGSAVARADIVTTDGQPVRWAVNALHRERLRQRVCGPQAMLEVCAAAARERLPIYLYGSRPEVIAQLVERLPARFPGLAIAGADPSRVRPRRFPPPVDEAEDRADVEAIRESGARILFIGLGCPLQETWAAAHRDRLAMPSLCVGAAFDFHAGLKARAPRWLQERGLEWTWRLAQDPRRLAFRYARYNSAFLVGMTVQLARALAARWSTGGVPACAS